MRNQLSRFSNVGPDSTEHLYPRCTDLDERMIGIFFTQRAMNATGSQKVFTGFPTIAQKTRT
jgi:hypothetical protein